MGGENISEVEVFQTFQNYFTNSITIKSNFWGIEELHPKLTLLQRGQRNPRQEKSTQARRRRET